MKNDFAHGPAPHPMGTRPRDYLATSPALISKQERHGPCVPVGGPPAVASVPKEKTTISPSQLTVRHTTPVSLA